MLRAASKNDRRGRRAGGPSPGFPGKRARRLVAASRLSNGRMTTLLCGSGRGLAGLGQDDFAEAEDWRVNRVNQEADHNAEADDGDGFEDLVDLVADVIQFLLIVI